MNTFRNRYDAIESIIFDAELSIKDIEISKDKQWIYILMSNDRTLRAPLNNYRGIQNATFKQLSNYVLIANKTGIHWPEIDEDLSLKGFLKEYLRKAIQNLNELVIPQ